ncbi:MAG: FxsA family protein [Candidatus Anammoxibacter sp.]
MFLKLFLAFTLIPVIEIYILIKIGSSIGAIYTIILVILTGFTGAYLARLQGMRTMLQVRNSVQQGIMPGNEMIDAFLILVAGIVLLTPGFITDITGIILLVPFTRRRINRFLKQKLEQWIRDKRDNITGSV